MKGMKIHQIGALFALIWFPVSAYAHSSGAESGFFHPLLGLDHLLTLVAVGIWSVKVTKARWLLPLTFLLSMNVSATAAAAGWFTIPFVEAGILASMFVISAVLGVRFGHSTLLAVPAIAVLASFHGAAHGIEAPVAQSLITYQLGFTLACALVMTVSSMATKRLLAHVAVVESAQAYKIIATLLGAASLAIGLS